MRAASPMAGHDSHVMGINSTSLLVRLTAFRIDTDFQRRKSGINFDEPHFYHVSFRPVNKRHTARFNSHLGSIDENIKQSNGNRPSFDCERYLKETGIAVIFRSKYMDRIKIRNDLRNEIERLSRYRNGLFKITGIQSRTLHVLISLQKAAPRNTKMRLD